MLGDWERDRELWGREMGVREQLKPRVEKCSDLEISLGPV